MIFKIGGSPYSDEIYNWVCSNKDKHVDDGFDDTVKVFAHIFTRIIHEDFDMAKAIEADVPKEAMEFDKYNPLTCGDYQMWYERETKRIEANKKEYERQMELIRTIRNKDPSKVSKKLRNMNAGQYYKLVWGIINSAMNVGTDNFVNHRAFIVREIREEWDRVKRYGFYLMLNEGLTEEQFGDLDESFVDRDHNLLNIKFSFFMFYMFSIVDKKLEQLIGLLGGENILIETRVNHGSTLDERYEFFYSKIKKEDDLNDFIIDVILKFGENHVTDYHFMLMYYLSSKRFDYKKNIKSQLPASEVWQTLYPTFFDKKQDTFNEFFKEFTDECIMYFLNNYVQWKPVKAQLPFFGLFMGQDGGLYNEVLEMVDIGDFNRMEKETYKYSVLD